MKYDSEKDTRQHINRVVEYVELYIEKLREQTVNHDKSKLAPHLCAKKAIEK